MSANNKKTIESIVTKLTDESIESIYLAGTRAIKAHIPSSDWDFFGIVNDKYDFKKEEEKQYKE